MIERHLSGAHYCLCYNKKRVSFELYLDPSNFLFWLIQHLSCCQTAAIMCLGDLSAGLGAKKAPVWSLFLISIDHLKPGHG